MLAALLLVALFTQDATSPEVLELVEQGAVARLEQRFAGQPTATQRGLLAEAAVNFAEQRSGPQRAAAFAEADRRYQAWIAAVGDIRGRSGEQRDVQIAEAELARAAMILTRWCANDLDRFELAPPDTPGFESLRTRVETAVERAAAAEALLTPLLEQLAAGDADLEEKFLALGIFDRVQVVRREAQLQQAWGHLHLARLITDEPKQRAVHLRSAERLFRTLAGLLDRGPVRVRCRIGLASIYREQTRYDEAVALLRETLPDATGFRLAAQVRYEWGRTHIVAGKFDEGRAVLAPLVQRDAAALDDDEQGGLFYVNLAQLWDAWSHLLESRDLRGAAPSSPVADTLLRTAAERRVAALARFNQLAGRGAEWEQLIDRYLAGELDLDAEPVDLAVAELLFVARRQGRAGDWTRAAELLGEAVDRPDVAADLLPDLRFEHAQALAVTGQRVAAATAFVAFVGQHVSHPLAARAVTRAYELQAEIADETRASDDYRAVAATLATLLARFPEHPQRRAATWWMPRALEAAGDYAEAARAYAGVPPQSDHWYEAQQRRNACLLAAWQADGAPAEAAPSIARTLLRFVDDVAARGRNTPAAADDARKAILDAAELYRLAADHPAVLRTLDHPRLADLDDAGAARRSGLRLVALAELGRYDAAARTAEEILARGGGGDRVLPLLQAGLDALATAEQIPGEIQLPEGMAAALLPVFEKAVEALRAGGEARVLEAVLFGLARLQFAAGRLEAAQQTITTLTMTGTTSGPIRFWRARILTARVAAAAGDERAKHRAAARSAWAALLPALRSAGAPQYWAGRYHALWLLRDDGEIEQVREAIRQERVWFPDLGGSPWNERIEALAAE